jgi:hypothetical protein
VDANDNTTTHEQGKEVQYLDPDLNQDLIRRAPRKGRDIRNDINLKNLFVNLIRAS